MTTEECIDELLHAGPCSYGCGGEISRKLVLQVVAKLRAAEEQIERQKKDIRALSNALGVALDGGYDNDDLLNMLQVLRSINAGKEE